ncbi:MAG: hypothetical protein IJJ71_03050 [Treponema sp.]|nr:hypothetical protein [Treponema sp.]MBR0495137.1 hypothetical protein [Treponema sp.]
MVANDGEADKNCETGFERVSKKSVIFSRKRTALRSRAKTHEERSV